MESTQSSSKAETKKRVCKATQASLNHILRGTTDRMIERRRQELAAEAEKEEAEGSTSPKIFKKPSYRPLQRRNPDQPAFDPRKEQMERRIEKLLID